MRVAQGDDAALGALYDRHAGLVFNLARAVTGTSGDAEEVTTDVFVRVWEDAQSFDASRGALRAWLATIARSKALDRVRARGRRDEAHARAAARSESGAAVDIARMEPADDRAYVSQLRSRLELALGHLNPDQRRAIELAYFGGLSQSEIAKRLGEPLGTVKTRIRDGMRRLRASFRTGGTAR